MKQKILKPVSEMPISFDLKDWESSDVPEDYLEQYHVDVDKESLEHIVEGADGRIEVDGDIVTRYMPACGGKSKVPCLLMGEWYHFYEDQYEASSGTHGIYFEGGRLVASDMNLFNTQTRSASPDNEEHMMLPGYPAPNWSLEVEWEREANQTNKGFDKVNNLFSYTGANGTQIEEIWLLVYPQGNKVLNVPEPPPNHLPVITKTQHRPVPGSKYIAIFVHDLDLTVDQYVNDAERRLLVGYYLIEPNKTFRVPACSLLNGAPDIRSNQLMKAMGYKIQFQEVHK